ncbi:MAG: twitching motility protein PilT, partial [Bradymonadia bacterium]
TGEGRVAVVEVLLQNYATSHMIRENKIHQLDAMLQSAESAGAGMMGLDTCLLRYLRQGVVTLEDALRIASDPDHLREMAANIPDDQ